MIGIIWRKWFCNDFILFSGASTAQVFIAMPISYTDYAGNTANYKFTHFLSDKNMVMAVWLTLHKSKSY